MLLYNHVFVRSAERFGVYSAARFADFNGGIIITDVHAVEKYRAESEEMFFGGKGINVSLVLSEPGIKSKALGFAAGFTRMAIEEGISEHGVETDFVRLDGGCSRINVKIKCPNEKTELNGQDPVISDTALEQLG